MRLLLYVGLVVSLALPSLCTAGTTPAPVFAAQICTAGLTLTLHPGLPPAAKPESLSVARDIPRAPVHVSAPVYPGARPLMVFVASAIPEYPADPYLQTGVAEYQSSGSVDTVKSWYRQALAGCGWHANGSMQTNVSALTSGITFASKLNHNLTMDMTFGHAPSGGAYIAYGAEEITYPVRPAASYLHGPFSQVRITLRRAVRKEGQPLWHVERKTVTATPTIARFVRSINAVTEYHTVLGVCMGGLSLVGPAWLSFVRPNGSVVHAYENGPGWCGGLAVNGVRWLIDPGSVWSLIGATA